MAIAVRPSKGGFIRAFGCGWFIREFLLGHGPEGSPTIDPEKGAPQADVFYHYKLALFKSYAEDAAVRKEEERAKREKRPISPDKIEELTAYYSERISYGLTGARYHSFINYFGMLKKLGWLEKTGVQEISTPQDFFEGFQPRVYYRLTRKGIEAPDPEWSNPKLVLYPQFSLSYHRAKRKQHHYSKRVPGKSHRAVKV